jgi:DNA-binding CsgD family transcriptional regulator/tetratricopeptide (TPR) repeat protein
MTLSLDGYWVASNQFRSGRRWMERLCAVSDQLPERTRAFALYAAARMATLQRDIDTAVGLFRQALPLMRQLSDPTEAGLALIWYGSFLGSLGNYEDAERSLVEALQLAESAPDSPRKQLVYGDALANLGVMARSRGEPLIAAERHKAALAHYRQHGIEYGELRSALDLADVARDRGNYRLAAERYREAIRNFALNRDERLLADAFEGLAASIVSPETATFVAKLCGLAEELRERVGVGFRWPADEAALRRCEGTLRSLLDPETLERSWNEGRTSLVDDMFAEIAELEIPVETILPDRTPSGWTGLTRRELDVLQLLVERRTDREIADLLFLSPRTVGWHVTGILAKLGVESRRQAARVAMEQGIIR